jgi:hypothetical protein
MNEQALYVYWLNINFNNNLCFENVSHDSAYTHSPLHTFTYAYTYLLNFIIEQALLLAGVGKMMQVW